MGDTLPIQAKYGARLSSRRYLEVDRTTVEQGDLGLGAKDRLNYSDAYPMDQVGVGAFKPGVVLNRQFDMEIAGSSQLAH
jgi:hypothetical protein